MYAIEEREKENVHEVEKGIRCRVNNNNYYYYTDTNIVLEAERNLTELTRKQNTEAKGNFRNCSKH